MTQTGHRIGRSMSQEQDRAPDALEPCPVCGQYGALIALGKRIDHPYRWRRWARVITDLYLCDNCDALVEVQAARGGGARRGSRDSRPVAA